MKILLVAVAVVAVALLVRVFATSGDPAKRARALKWTGFAVTAFLGAILGLLLVGDTVSDPGGWEAVGLIAAWAVPLAGACLLCWRHPDLATRVLALATGAVIAMSVWFAADYHGWRSFENQNGPIRAIVVFVLAAALVYHGLRRTLPAAIMLTLIGIVPMAFSLGYRAGFTSTAVACTAPLITGVLYLAAALTARSGPPTDSSRQMPSPTERNSEDKRAA